MNFEHQQITLYSGDYLIGNEGEMNIMLDTVRIVQIRERQNTIEVKTNPEADRTYGVHDGNVDVIVDRDGDRWYPTGSGGDWVHADSYWDAKLASDEYGLSGTPLHEISLAHGPLQHTTEALD